MNDNIVRIEPTPIALFTKIDDDPGFSIKLCNEASLFQAVSDALFFSPDPLGADEQLEVSATVDKLKEAGDVAFEDGWMSLRIGMANVTALLLQKIKEAKEEERYADTERYKELEKRRETELKYTILCQALVEALGGKAGEIASLANTHPGKLVRA